MTVSEIEEELGLPEYQLAYEVTDLEGNKLLPAYQAVAEYLIKK